MVIVFLTSLRASFTCGLAGALASNPIDVVRTRMMNQSTLPSGTHSGYKSTVDCLLQVSTVCLVITDMELGCLDVFIW